MYKISEEHNAKRGPEPSKVKGFWIVFYEMFMLFTNTLPELIFRVLKCQPKRKSTICGRILEPRAAPNWAFGATVFAEETKRDRRGADLAEFWYPNLPKV